MSASKTTNPLFTPFSLGPLSLKNRIVMAPMTRQQSPNYVPTAATADYYARRAAGGVGLIITEGVGIGHDKDLGADDIPRLQGAEALAGWAQVVDKVHAAGGKIMPQLWHVGATFSGGVGPSDVHHPNLNDDEAPGPALSDDDIQNIIKDYAQSARNAQELGFDGVEVHGAHGYLIDQFLWDKTNKRTDQYGGESIAQRVRFATDVVAAIREAVGPLFPIVFRFSQWKLGDYDARLVETPEALASMLLPLKEAGVDIFHASTRRYNDPEFEGSNLNLAGWAKKITGKPAITVGNIGLERAFKDEGDTPVACQPFEPLYARLEAGEFDLAAVGRALIANPNWANAVELGAWDTLTPYENTMRYAPVY
jgi:2,4-dienoyl-CoA reductase-like NADH-dependent reductase (Old Yellow Enzyme family)